MYFTIYISFKFNNRKKTKQAGQVTVERVENRFCGTRRRTLRHHATDVEHAERWAARRTRTSTTKPDLRLCLILSTGKPSAHALQTPHRPTLAAAARRHRVVLISTMSPQLDARHGLHAAHTLLQHLHRERERTCVKRRESYLRNRLHISIRI